MQMVPFVSPTSRQLLPSLPASASNDLRQPGLRAFINPANICVCKRCRDFDIPLCCFVVHSRVAWEGRWPEPQEPRHQQDFGGSSPWPGTHQAELTSIPTCHIIDDQTGTRARAHMWVCVCVWGGGMLVPTMNACVFACTSATPRRCPAAKAAIHNKFRSPRQCKLGGIAGCQPL